METGKSIYRAADKSLIGVFIILVLMGWFNIYAAVYDESYQSIFDISQRYGKQMLFIAFAFVIALVVMLIDIRFFTQFSYVFYGISILGLLAVLVIGTEIAGNKSWIQLGGFSIQPSEFAKFATCLAFAKYVSSPDVSFKRVSSQIVSSLWFLLPMVLILLQPDAGSALVYTAFILVMYREGMSGNVLLLGIMAIVLFILALLLNTYVLLAIIGLFILILMFYTKKSFKNIAFAIGLFFLSGAFVYSVDYAFQKLGDHQKSRINVLLGKDPDLKGAGYNINQSKIAIGSGGLFGKGYLEGTQTKFNFVPEQSTDFIFCTIGEEWGLVGSSVVLCLFLFMFIRIIQLAERQRSDFTRIYGYGVACILFFHVFVNIGMTIGLLPVIGIPLPFFSYGGSSLWSFTLLLFVFIKMDAKRYA